MRMRRRVKPTPMVPMASMSDIAFLLIIFFMVSTTFMKEAGLKAKPPRTRTGEELKQKSLGTITVDEKGETYLDGDPTSIMLLGGRIQDRLAKKELKDKIIVLKCDKDIKSALFVPIIEQVSKTGVNLEIWVEPKRDKEE